MHKTNLENNTYSFMISQFFCPVYVFWLWTNYGNIKADVSRAGLLAVTCVAGLYIDVFLSIEQVLGKYLLAFKDLKAYHKVFQF